MDDLWTSCDQSLGNGCYAILFGMGTFAVIMMTRGTRCMSRVHLLKLNPADWTVIWLRRTLWLRHMIKSISQACQWKALDKRCWRPENELQWNWWIEMNHMLPYKDIDYKTCFTKKVGQIVRYQGPLLLTWFNFNPSMNICSRAW